MDSIPYQKLCKQPDVFSRGALQLTFKALRKRNASLALQIQNVLGGTPLEKPSDYPNQNPMADHFQLAFNLRQVREIITGLAEAESSSNNFRDTTQRSADGNLIMLRALLEDWRKLSSNLTLDTSLIER